MKTKKIAVVLLVIGSMLIPATRALGAGTSPVWQLTVTPLPTNFKPGTSGTTFEAPLYRIAATNIGGAGTTGPVTFGAVLPTGIKPIGAEGGDFDFDTSNPTCGFAGQVVTCNATGPVYPGYLVGAIIPVEVSPLLTEGEVLEAEATISGGGATPVSVISPTEMNSDPPGFGFLPGAAGLSTQLTNADGSATSQAGSHPNQMTVSLGFPTEQVEAGAPTSGAGQPRDVHFDLPRGLLANPQASAHCTEAEMIETDGPYSKCPDAAQVGTVTAMTEEAGPLLAISELFNMQPPAGVPAELAFNALNVGIYVHLKGTVRSNGDYGVSASTDDIIARPNNPILSILTQLWGDPSGESHNEIRQHCRSKSASRCPVEPQQTPLITMPSACSGPLSFTAAVKSWQESEATPFHLRSAQSTDVNGNPVDVTSCSALEFEPTLTLTPGTSSAETPTGVQIDLHVPQNEGKDELATSNVKDTKVVLPAGMAVNPASAGGLQACSSAQIDLHQGTHPGCPEASKIGTVEVTTPLLDHTVPGAIYVATPYDNPFNSLLAVYVVVDDPQTGVVIKLAGKTEADPVTGQLTTTFKEAPELPFEDFKVNLFGGPRATLRTPATCGTFTTTSEQVPWSGNAPVSTTDSFKVSQGANGRPCATSEASLPNEPGFEAGTETPIAASYSPFLGRLQRADGTQQLQGLNLTLPPGLSGKLAGVPSCSDTAIAAASHKSGTQELASPSCPAASQVGVVTTGVGAGSQPYYTSGKVYIAGPYEGAPISVVTIAPAVAGPFDLGTVVVRAPLFVDRDTAIIRVKSDPFPRILEGIPLAVRDIRIDMNKPDFTLNPTSCDQMSISGEEISVPGQIASLFSRFQVGGCRGLDFEPSLSLQLKGGTGRGAHPRLKAIGTAKPGEANLAYASVALPHSEFLDQAHIRTVCTRVQFAANQCPKGAVYGQIRAKTPLLDEELSGPVYLRSSSHELPDLVATLHGPPSRPIEIDVVGRIDSIHGGIRTTIESVPDAPVSKFVLSMQGGKKGLLINSRNLCASVNRATVKLNGQNGKVHDFRPELKADCGKKGKRKRH